ncbi:hypothetical protein L8Y91_02480 [Campylobacter lari]|uniref:hypothetical protein n=1 Tax=Campylobacter lari TaxID=201 RepID=UPI0008745D52|nr:hypothetical protein [Campylobacter lari]EAC1839842.1 hypothetical protein [Campylobacter lari]EAH4935156.1 hypothetical protein [Campylobacter lari]EAH6293261.1 hypothetical protein [Campylobacter lari]EAH7780120.1 hypothetical protein [Campylobacter lari]EAH7837375.1 hypothetical protein [Campylobacter lari]
MFKSYKKFVIYSLLIPLPFILFLGVLLYVYDPLQLYHEPWFRKKTYCNDLTIGSKGIIDHNKFDSIIFGTSMLQNTSSFEASSKLGGQFINLSIGGSTFEQRRIILDYILKKHTIKYLVTSLDEFAIMDVKFQNFSNFSYLYDQNPYNDLKIYLNKKFIFCALKFSSSKKCVGDDTELENLPKWIKSPIAQKQFGGIENWVKNIEEGVREDIKKIMQLYNGNYIHDYSSIDLNVLKNHIDIYIFNYAKMYPNVQFSLILPTYSRVYHKMAQVDFQYYQQWVDLIKYIILESKTLENVKIYGFDDLDYAGDIVNYKDLNHYNIDMNSMQLDAIKNQTNILTPENMDEYFKIMEEKIKNYDLNPLIEQIKASGILDK